MSRSFLDAAIPDLVKQLSIDEKISLLGAPNWWNTTPIPRLGIPSIRMSDGPNGVRGSSHFVSVPAQCLPCATSMASTFDVDLLHEVGAFLAEEAKIKSSVIILAPTCNIQRNPLGGRAFESFSEDPHLSGTMAAAYIQGLQENGVSATIKHFVGNDQEHERTAADSVMSERALREIYLYPFMLAQKIAKPWAFMTSYGRIDGIHISENPRFLKGILREEWGFDGVVISDWFGTYSVDLSINAGMDLEMPGPPRWRTPLLVNHTLSCQKVLPTTIDERITNLLGFIQRQARRNPDIVFGDGVERTRDGPEIRAFGRKLASEGMVLLKNEGGVLPLRPTNTDGKPTKVAIIGPNAQGRVISGGGSAQLRPSYVVTPYDGILANAPEGFEFEYHIGAYGHKYLPTLEAFLTTESATSGWTCRFYNHDEKQNPIGSPVAEFILQDTRVKLNDFLPNGLTPTWTIKLNGKLTMPKTATYELGLTVAGRAKLWVDGELVIDNWTRQRPGEFFYGQGTVEEKGLIALTAGVPADIYVEYTNTKPPEGPEADRSQPALMRGVRLGGAEKIDPEGAIEEAIKIAAASDAVIIVAGLTPEWESEGFDRPSLDLPGRQSELISRVSSVNPNTIVCLQAGSAVSMPWVGGVSGIIQAWYSGNGVGEALADVIFGKVNPSGRLALSFPAREQDNPAYMNTRSENGKIHYREDLFVGYKWYQARGIQPLFPFGFGLSYTTFSFSNFTITKPPSHDASSFSLSVEVTITNEGPTTGSEVVQVYITLPDIGVTTPTIQLRGFSKAKDINPGKSEVVIVRMDKYAISFWDTSRNVWRAKEGKYDVLVGKSSQDIIFKGAFILEEDFEWSGL